MRSSANLLTLLLAAWAASLLVLACANTVIDVDTPTPPAPQAPCFDSGAGAYGGKRT